MTTGDSDAVVVYRTETGAKYVSVTSVINVERNRVVNQRMAESSVAVQSRFEANLQRFWLERGLRPKPYDEAVSL